MEIPVLSISSSSEDIGVGRNECDLYVKKTVQYVSIDEKNTNKSYLGLIQGYYYYNYYYQVHTQRQ
jgi:hypothetical protein